MLQRPRRRHTPLVVAQAHAEKGCTFKTCATVAAYTLRRDAGMSSGVSVDGAVALRWPGAATAGRGREAAGGRGLEVWER